MPKKPPRPLPKRVERGHSQPEQSQPEQSRPEPGVLARRALADACDYVYRDQYTLFAFGDALQSIFSAKKPSYFEALAPLASAPDPTLERLSSQVALLRADLAIERAERSAQEVAAQLVDELEAFRSELASGLEAAVSFVGCAGERIIVRRIDYREPRLVVFSGVTTEGAPVRLVQDVSQVNYMIVAVPRADPEAPRLPIALRRDAPIC